jgi:membrane peptidoglycan carboxypeptidase
MPARSATVKVLSLLLCGLLAGLVVAGFALPATAVAGLAARYAGESFEELPGDLQTTPSAQTTYIYANDGRTLITTFYEENRTDVPITEIPTVLQQAIVAAEDIRFYEHGGVDLRGVARAMVANSGGEVQQGASTLTMQYVRNVLKGDKSKSEQQREEATKQTAGRKLREMRHAVAIEKQLPKEEILRRYLNIAYFGNGSYGVYAASRGYFAKAPKQLTLAEAALIAGLVQSPDADNPATGDRTSALARRAYVLDSMARMNVITPQQADAAKKEELKLRLRTQPNNCTAVGAKRNSWGFFCDYFVRWWKSQPAFGATEQERENNLKRGGYSVVTSLDPRTQAAALRESLSVYGYQNPRALPIAVVEAGTGRVQALAINRRYSLAKNPKGQPNHPNTVNQLIAGSSTAAGYQAGSTFKMFTMLAALESGLPLNTTLTTKSPLRTQWPASGPGSCGGFYCPANATPKWMDGTRTMWNGFGRSVNTYFVKLEEQVGAEKVVAMAQRLGITFRAQKDAEMARDSASEWGSFTLGVSATTPLDLANAYATLAADGLYCAPLPVRSITDAAGQPVAAAQPTCRQAVTPEVARAGLDAARCPVGQQSAFGRCDGGTADGISSVVGRPVAGKTGSSENNATETFVATTPQLAAAGIAANPDDPTDYVGEYVASAVNAAVARALASALRDEPVKEFTPPARETAFGR